MKNCPQRGKTAPHFFKKFVVLTKTQRLFKLDFNFIKCYTSNGYIVPMEFPFHFFPRISAFSRRTTMHLNG